MSEQEIVRILARARFKFRSDTLVNWVTENPILLSGEFGVVTGLNEDGDGKENKTQKVKIGDGISAWNDLDWWYGPKGDKGEQGIQGPQGIQGEKGEKGDVNTEYLHNNFANALKGTKSGSAISVNDVSVVEHNLRIKLTSDTITDFTGIEVRRYGKNLWNKEYAANKSNWKQINSSYDGISIYVGKGNKVTISYKNTLGTGLGFYTAVMTEFSTADAVSIWLYHNGISSMTNRTVTLTAIEDYIYVRTSDRAVSYQNFMKYIGNDLQIEIGETATELKPYIEPQTAIAIAGGTVEGLTSLSPNMTLVSDTEGVVINLEYNIDTKMYIDNELAKIKAELSAAIVNS